MGDFALDCYYYFVQSVCLHFSREKSERFDATHATSKFLASYVVLLRTCALTKIQVLTSKHVDICKGKKAVLKK